MTDAGVLARRASALLDHDRRVVLGVTGPPGAGKSTLVEELLGLLRAAPPAAMGSDWVAHVPMDGFHLADVQLDRLGRRDRKGAPDTFDSGGYLAALRRITDDRPADVYTPGFERDLEQPIAAAVVVPAEVRLVVTEGNYLLLPDGDWPAIRSLMAEVWYVDLPGPERLRRLVARHVASGKSEAEARRWVERVDEANARLVEESRSRADIVVGATR